MCFCASVFTLVLAEPNEPLRTFVAQTGRRHAKGCLVVIVRDGRAFQASSSTRSPNIRPIDSRAVLKNSWTFSIIDCNLSILGKPWAVHYPYAHPGYFVPTGWPGILVTTLSRFVR